MPVQRPARVLRYISHVWTTCEFNLLGRKELYLTRGLCITPTLQLGRSTNQCSTWSRSGWWVWLLSHLYLKLSEMPSRTNWPGSIRKKKYALQRSITLAMLGTLKRIADTKLPLKCIQRIIVVCTENIHSNASACMSSTNHAKYPHNFHPNATSGIVSTIHTIYHRNFHSNTTSGIATTLHTKYLSNSCSDETSSSLSSIHTEYLRNFHSNATSGMGSTIHAENLCNFCLNTMFGRASTIHAE